jgi:hypothetical protein
VGFVWLLHLSRNVERAEHDAQRKIKDLFPVASWLMPVFIESLCPPAFPFWIFVGGAAFGF